jgi:hypothetical protein
MSYFSIFSLMTQVHVETEIPDLPNAINLVITVDDV